MSKLTIKHAAEIFEVTPKTLRGWERTGQIKSERTAGGYRRYEVNSLLGNKMHQH